MGGFWPVPRQLLKNSEAAAFRVLLSFFVYYTTSQTLAFPQPRFQFLRTKSITKAMGNKDLGCQRMLGSITQANSVCSLTGFLASTLQVELKHFREMLRE